MYTRLFLYKGQNTCPQTWLFKDSTVVKDTNPYLTLHTILPRASEKKLDAKTALQRIAGTTLLSSLGTLQAKKEKANPFFLQCSK